MDKSYLQELFDRVADHLLKQGERSCVDEVAHGDELPKPQCRYRGPNGLKCAVGALITDEAYSPDIEGGAANRGDVRDALLASGVRLDNYEEDGDVIALLAGVQYVHDGREPDQWREALYLAASDFGLDPHRVLTREEGDRV